MSTISYQEAVLGELVKYAERNGCIAMTEYRFSNVGRLIIGPSPFEVKVTIDFQFNSGGKNMLLFNGKQHGPPSPDNYFFSASEPEKVLAAVLRLRVLLGDKLIEEKDR